MMFAVSPSLSPWLLAPGVQGGLVVGSGFMVRIYSNFQFRSGFYRVPRIRQKGDIRDQLIIFIFIVLRWPQLKIQLGLELR